MKKSRIHLRNSWSLVTSAMIMSLALVSASPSWAESENSRATGQNSAYSVQPRNQRQMMPMSQRKAAAAKLKAVNDSVREKKRAEDVNKEAMKRGN